MTYQGYFSLGTAVAYGGIFLKTLANLARSIVLRVAGTPHYDGVIAGGSEPAVIAICGMSPVDVKLVDPEQPGWRAV